MLWRATVVDVVGGLPVVTVPRRSGARLHGPLPTVIAGLEVDDRVLVADELDGTAALVVVGRFT